MKSKKSPRKKVSQVNETVGIYKQEIHFFSSMGGQEEYSRKKMAAMSPAELLDKLEEMRRFFLSKYLDSNGNWRPLAKKITIKEPKVK